MTISLGNIFGKDEILDRMEELKQDVEGIEDYEFGNPDMTEEEIAFFEDHNDEIEEYEELKELLDIVNSHWGETFVREDYLEEYAKELCRDTIYDFEEYRWPFNCIDWGKAVQMLQQDMSCISVGDDDFWY